MQPAGLATEEPGGWVLIRTWTLEERGRRGEGAVAFFLRGALLL